MGVEFGRLEWCTCVAQYVGEGQRCVTFSHPWVGMVCARMDPHWISARSALTVDVGCMCSGSSSLVSSTQVRSAIARREGT
jgi:hypothetical protein